MSEEAATTGLRFAIAAFLLVGCSLDSLSSKYGSNVTTDGGNGGDGGDPSTTSSFCGSLSTRPTFCDDFDRGADFVGWDDKVTANNALLSIDRTRVRSPPGALAIAIPDSDNQDPVAFLTKKVARTFNEATLSFAINPDDLDGKTKRAVSCSFLVKLPDGDAVVRVILGAVPYLNEIKRDSSDRVVFGKDYPISGTMASNTWSQVELVLTLSTPSHVRMKINGESALDQALGAAWGPGELTANVGLYLATAPTRAFRVRIDDVVIDAH